MRLLMKWLICLASTILIFGGITKAQAPADTAPPVPREFRAAWVATVANIDWPSKRGLPASQQKSEMITIIENNDSFVKYIKLAKVIFILDIKVYGMA